MLELATTAPTKRLHLARLECLALSPLQQSGARFVVNTLVQPLSKRQSLELAGGSKQTAVGRTLNDLRAFAWRLEVLRFLKISN
jgi:hypothetical protein